MRKIVVCLIVCCCLKMFGWRVSDFFDYEYEGTLLSYEVVDSVAMTCVVTHSRSEASGTSIIFYAKPEGDVVIPEYAYNKNDGHAYKVVRMQSAFSACNRVRSVYVPNTVKDISACTFKLCSVRTVKLPEGLQIISKNLFDESSLVDITLPPTVTEIEERAFFWCGNLKNVVLSPALRAIGESAFALSGHVPSLNYPYETAIVFNNHLPMHIGEKAFDRSIIKEVKIRSLQAWSSSLFEDPTSNPISQSRTFSEYDGESSRVVRNLNIGVDGDDQLGNIGVRQYAFINAENLETVRVKGQKIERGAFKYCANIRSICLEVEQLGFHAFKNTNKLKYIYSLTTVPPVSNEAFTNYEGVTLRVPRGSLEAYRSAREWSKFSTIEESDFEDLESVFEQGRPDEISEILSDSVIDENQMIFTLDGRPVIKSKSDLTPGIYLTRRAGKVEKFIVK